MAFMNDSTNNIIGLLVGAAPLDGAVETLKNLLSCKQYDCYIIGLDGGILPLYSNNLPAHEWIGDMDSFAGIGEEEIMVKYPNIKVEKCSPIKDYTDMELGVIKLINMGIRDIRIFGGLGGMRISHSIANINMLHKYVLEGVRITAYSDRTQLFILNNGKACFDKDAKGYISVFSVADISRGVKIKGLFYEYEGDLSSTNTIGQSNEFAGRPSEISVMDGSLLIIKEDLR